LIDILTGNFTFLNVCCFWLCFDKYTSYLWLEMTGWLGVTDIW
jgi:hypothetical protein